MNRRGGAWIAILCILVVGVSVTKMTKRFVSSAGTEAAAFSSTLGMWSEADDISVTQSGEGRTSGAAVSGAQAEAGGADTRTGAAVTGAAGAMEEAAGDMENAAGAVAEAAGDMENAAGAVAEGAGAMEEAAGAVVQEAAAAETAEGEEESAAMQETVKSPLDPGTGEESGSEAPPGQQYTYDELVERLEAAELQSRSFRAASGEASPGSAYVAAEQEYQLWDTELNVIYNAILSRMTASEAELLRQDEVEWLRERDLETDRGMMKAANQMAQNTNHLRLLREATKERCYELVSGYQEILTREKTPETPEAAQPGRP